MNGMLAGEDLHLGATRDRFQGIREVLAYNRPFYLTGIALAAIAIAAAPFLAPIAAVALSVAAALALFWIVASLYVAHAVYDRSGLDSGAPLAALAGPCGGAWAELHTGLPWTAAILRAGCSGREGAVLDIYDPIEMTEASILRARRRNGPCGEPADFRRLPRDDRSMDLLFLIFAAHELRSARARNDLFGEMRRILAPEGRILLVEHLRSVTNGIAFGPGVLHFFPRQTWLEAASRAGMRVTRETSLTPFATIFTIEVEP